MSWKAGVAAEVIGIPSGSIGEQLYQSKVYFDLTSLYAWTVAIVCISVLLEKAVLLLVRRLYERLERI
jgi:NitT/TauT family transport system permease protein